MKVFVSYAHADAPYFKVFEQTLKTQLKSNKSFNLAVWEDSQIHLGTLWDEEIQKQLAECDLAILCISDNFLASDYIKAKEFGVIIKQFSKTVTAPMLFAPCNYKEWDELAARQIFMPKGNKYDEATNDDFTFADLVRFNKKDGDLVPNPNISRYIKDFVLRIEEALTPQHTKTTQKITIPVKGTPVYINPNNYPYFEKDNFFGRDELLKQVDDKLKTLDIPFLLSGIGGMGKTAVAVAYGKDKTYCIAYDNIAWVDVTENVFSNLFSTFHSNPIIPFDYSSDGDRGKDIASVMDSLKKTGGNNLLIIDNVNDEVDLQQFISEWKNYEPGWKCLVTTRCENNNYKNHLIKLQIISLEAAEELFKRHNDEGFENQSFKEIHEYIGGHTFLIELLAKFGQESSTISSTAELLAHLRTKGIKALNKAVIAKQGQQQETDNLVSEFVLGLYDPLVLYEKEQEYLRYFSILPATDIEFMMLVYLFGIDEVGQENFDGLLNILFKKGWLIHTGSAFKCHQIIQEICKEKLRPDAENCSALISCLNSLFINSNTTQATPFFEIGLLVANSIKDIDYRLASMQFYLAIRIIETGNLTDSFNLLIISKNIASELKDNNMVCVCLERMGTLFRIQGNFEEAMKYYLQYNSIEKELSEKNSDNLGHKNGLAISYQKLGNIYLLQGNMEDALECYRQYNFIENEISEKNPGNDEYKNHLAASYSKLGEIYQAQENMSDAMKCYEQFNFIVKEVSEKNPKNEEYKNGLAISYQYLGIIYQTQQNITGALECYQKDMEISKELSDNNPENMEHKNNLAISYTHLAGLSIVHEKKFYYLEAQKIWKELVAKVPQSIEYKENLDWVNDILKDLE